MKAPLTQKAADFIITQEGFTAVSVWDYKQYSWGYGTKAKAGGLSITRDAARLELIKEIAPLELKVKDLNITDNAKVALISFGFNTGVGNLNNLLKNIKKGYTLQQTADQMKLYTKAGGKVLQGLVNRRNKEAALYLS